MNAYADLTTLKSSAYLNIAGTGDDDYLRFLLEASGRAEDNFTKRFFYSLSATRYYDGAGQILFTDDILFITTLKTDDGCDGTYEETWTANEDYELYPLNSYPKMWAEISSRTTREYSTFNNGVKKGVQIIGVFGYGDGESATPYTATAITGTVATTTGTTLTLSADGTIKVGHTILCESEQMYVTAVATGNATVKRGINGTTGAIHSAKALSVYQYPELITQCCLMQAARWWKRKDSAFANVVGNAELGTTDYYKALDPEIKALLSGYERYRV